MASVSPGTAFYCVSSGEYFLGAVAMINSLRLQGHDEPIYLLDRGLAAEQRELLDGEVSLVEAPPGTEPWLVKTIAPLRHPHQTMVLIDVDMIVTRRLDELIGAAASGQVVAFENDSDRWVAEWGEILDLEPARLPPRPYLCSGFVALAADPGLELLELIDDRQRRVEFERTFFAANDESYPLLFLDQDVLNAVLASRVEPERVLALDHRLMAAVAFDEPHLLDSEALRVRFADDGAEPYVVHYILPQKPWLKPIYESVYSRLLKRCLVGPGLAIDVPRRALPLRFRSGPLARAERARVDAAVWLRFQLGVRVARWRARLGLPEHDPVPRL